MRVCVEALDEVRGGALVESLRLGVPVLLVGETTVRTGVDVDVETRVVASLPPDVVNALVVTWRGVDCAAIVELVGVVEGVVMTWVSFIEYTASGSCEPK